MRVAFFGTSAFGAGALERLVRDHGIDIAVVVSQPDRPAGRGRRSAPPPVAVTAAALGLPLLQTERVSADPPAADVGAVVAFGQILRRRSWAPIRSSTCTRRSCRAGAAPRRSSVP